MRARPTRVHALLAAVAVAAVAVVVLLSAGASVVHPSAAQALEDAAQTAETATPIPTLRPGDYWYVRAQGTITLPMPLLGTGRTQRPSFIWVRANTIEETWTGTGPLARSRWLVRGPLVIASASDRARWRAVGSPPLMRLPPGTDTIFTKARGFPIGLGMFSYRQLRHLPTDPHALLATLAHAARHSAVARSAPRFGPALLTLTEFEAIHGLLVEPLQPATRAALFRTAALLPGVRYLGTRTDTLGRHGSAIGLDWRHHILFTLIYDPNTSALLGVDDDRANFSYVAQGRVGTLRSLPASIAPITGPLPRTRLSNPSGHAR